MKTTRFLLPFMHGVDKFAIEQAILLAKSHHATLIPLVLIHVPEGCRKTGVRLEYMQQSMDFLETVKHKAYWHSVQIERLEVFTSDIVQSINLVASEMECEGVLLLINQKGGVLLQVDQIKSIIEMPPCKIYIIHLPAVQSKSFVQAVRSSISRLFSGGNVRQGDRMQDQEYLVEEAELPTKA